MTIRVAPPIAAIARSTVASRLLDVRVVGSDRSFEVAALDREQRRLDDASVSAPVLFPRGALQLGEAFEAERLRETHDGRARGVRTPRELLGGLKGGLVEVVDDVLRDVLLRARTLVEARLDVARQRVRRGAVAARGGHVARGGSLRHQCGVHSTIRSCVPLTVGLIRSARRRELRFA
jgi:hypothetical protein